MARWLMTELTAIRWRTLLWFLLFPATFLGWVPWWLHRQFEGPFRWEGDLLHMTAVHLFVVLAEEPELTTRFGPSYEAYLKRVSRWIPRRPV